MLFDILVLDIERLRRIDPNLEDITDEELTKIKDSLYELGHLIFDDWKENVYDSKYPVGDLTRPPESVE